MRTLEELSEHESVSIGLKPYHRLDAVTVWWD